MLKLQENFNVPELARTVTKVVRDSHPQEYQCRCPPWHPPARRNRTTPCAAVGIPVPAQAMLRGGVAEWCAGAVSSWQQLTAKERKRNQDVAHYTRSGDGTLVPSEVGGARDPPKRCRSLKLQLPVPISASKISRPSEHGIVKLPTDATMLVCKPVLKRKAGHTGELTRIVSD